NALVIEAAFMRHREKQYLSVRQSPARYLPFAGLPADALYQSVSSPFDEASLFSHYIYAKRSWRMNVDVDASWHSRHLHSTLDTLSSAKEARHGLDSFLNNGQLRRFNSRASFTLSRQIKDLQFSTSLAGHFFYNRPSFSGNGYNGLNAIRLYPSFSNGIKWKTANQTFSANYSYDRKFPGITDLYEGYLLSDYRSLQKGIYLFSDRPVHTVSLGYTYVCLPKQLLLYIAFSHVVVNRVPVSDLRLTANYDIITQTPVLSGMAYSLYSIGIDKFINILNAGIKLKTTVSANRYRDVLNGVGSRKIKSMGSIMQLSLRSAFRGIFNYNAGIIFNYSKSRVISRPGSLFQNHIFNPFLDLHFKFPEKLRVIINNEVINNNKKYCYFTDLSLQYELIRSKASFVLTGKNLLNNKKYLYTQIDDHSIQIQQYDLRPLYVLLQLNYRF
ncbi:MAG TPA: hypothetical protein VJ647_02385, partial [Chitinophagaceae bacterium]|nr:hypothetical protein [Chitinophagaceae bacterium]